MLREFLINLVPFTLYPPSVVYSLRKALLPMVACDHVHHQYYPIAIQHHPGLNHLLSKKKTTTTIMSKKGIMADWTQEIFFLVSSLFDRVDCFESD